jgi:hypothetical protein
MSRTEYEIVSPINGLGGAAQNINRGVNAAQSIISANRRGNLLDVTGIANDIAKLSVKDPKAANRLRSAKQVTPVIKVAI